MMPYRRVVLVLLSFLAATVSNAQRYHWDLGIFSSGATGVEIVDIEVDSDGNSYVLANFSGSPNLNPGGTPALVKNSFSNSNLFLAKYDRTGALIAGRAVTGVNLIVGTDLVMDGDDFVYITGSFSGFALFETGGVPGSFNRSATGGSDIFLLKYSAATLLYQWDYVAGGASDESGHGVAVDANGDVFLTGGYNGTVDFDGAGALAALTSNGGEDMFLAKIDDATGNILYRHSFGSTNNDRGQTVDCTSGTNLYVGGYFNGLMDIDPVGVQNIAPILGQDGFVIRFSDAGTLGLLNSVVIAGNGTNEVGLVKVSKADLPYVTANFEQTVSLGGVVTRTSNGSVDGLVMQYPVDLSTPNWATVVGGTGIDAVFGMTLDVCGNVFITGSYQGTVDFNPGAAASNLTGPTGVNSGYYVAKYLEGTGSFILAGGEEIAGRDNSSAAVALDRGGNVLLGLNTSSAADTDVSVDAVNLSLTPPVTATGTMAYVTRSATGDVIVDETAATGIGTLDAAMDWVEWNATPDTVCFCLTGTAPFTINKPQDLVAVSADSTSIYATTQNGWYLGAIILDGPGAATPGAGIYIDGVETEVIGLTIQDYETGIYLTNSLNYRVGVPNRGNQLLNNGYGLRTMGSYGSVQANQIGTDAASTTNLGNSVAGVSFDAYAAVTTIGGLGAGEANIIGFNTVGVEDVTGTTNATIVGNNFSCNTGGGIQISGGSFTPAISIAFVSSISGTGPANETIHLYEVNNAACGGTPPCQGFTYLGSALSDALGNWALPGVFTAGSQVTATATDAAGKTSEFSLCNIVTSILEPAFIELEEDQGILTWNTSEDLWTEFELVASDQGMIVLQESLQSGQRSVRAFQSGTYVVVGKLQDGREIRSNTVELTIEAEWLAYQDGNELIVGQPGAVYNASLVDIQGKLVWSGQKEGVSAIGTDAWPKGVYLLSIQDNSGFILRKKLLLR